MIRSKVRCPGCGCQQRIKAVEVMAIIDKGSLLGLAEMESNDPRRRLQPLHYEVIEFCASPVCERVFKAERKAA